MQSEDWRSRTELIIGARGLARLERSRVMVVGLGGVGAACVEALARAGVGALDLVDADVVAPSNINRQLIADTTTLGLKKAEVAAARVRAINPQCEAVAHSVWVDAGNVDALLARAPDYVADAIDSIGSKIELILAALRAGVPIVSSMGAGNKLDPTRFRIADISRTHTCPMARAVRTALRKRGVTGGLTVVFSDEPPASQASRPPGSFAPVPPAAGLAMASAILRALLAGLQ
ncbi:MAG: tRNA threonylcarbamoyladenosine dehydratase [Firmicutes bacterium]|nr:tRNA threonylcarbamoyladenosine dehydratase [Bacillota bacterium]